MITSLTTRYRVVFALSLVLCVLPVFGVPLAALAWGVQCPPSSLSCRSPALFDGGGYYWPPPDSQTTPWDDSDDDETPPEPEPNTPEREGGDDGEEREGGDDGERPREPRRDPIRTESCDVEWGHWYVDVITHVIPKLQINTLTNVTTGIPVMSKLSVTTKYTERRDGEVICRVYLDGVYSHSYTNGTRTDTRPGERTDYNSIKVIDHIGDLTVLRINETSGDLVLQWSNRHDAYRVHVDVVVFDGSLRQNLPVQVYIWPNGETTSAIKVQTYRSVRVD